MAGFWLLRPPDPPGTISDEFERPNESPAVGWQDQTVGGTFAIVSNLLTGSGLAPYQPGKGASVNITPMFSGNQFARAYFTTVGGAGGTDGGGPCVRVKGTGDALPYGYDLVVSPVSTSLYSPTSLIAMYEAGAAGDVWEIQVWGPPSATFIRVLRNWRVAKTTTGLSVVRDTTTALANIPKGGAPGMYGSGGGPNTYSRFVGGDLPGEMIPFFVSGASDAVAFMQSDAFQVADYTQDQPTPGGTAFQIGQSNAFQGPAGIRDADVPTTAFQQNAFQTDAFQIYGTGSPVGGSGGDEATTPPHPSEDKRRRVRYDDETLRAMLLEQIEREDREILKVIEAFCEQGTVYRVAA